MAAPMRLNEIKKRKKEVEEEFNKLKNEELNKIIEKDSTSKSKKN